MKKYILSILIIITISVPAKLFAWGEKGHALVAEIAFNYLDANTKNIIMSYLDGMTIEDAANWMDKIKSDKKYDYMRKLHYINADKGQNIMSNSDENIVGALMKTINELRNYKTLSNEDVKIKICIIFHLIGDLHQPLHVGYGSDKGGNTVQIYYNYKGTNLHSLWDSGIIEYKNITLFDCMSSNKFSKLELDKIKEINVVNWSNDSRSLLDKIYKINANNPSDEYIDSSATLIKAQIFKAGVRLAAVLKQTFGTS